MTLNRSTILSWIGGAGLGMAFATGGWAMAVQTKNAEQDRRIERIEQPFTDLRIEMSALRAEVKALTRALENQGK